MYRLFHVFTATIILSAGMAATAQQPELEFTFVEDMDPIDPSLRPKRTESPKKSDAKAIDFQKVFDVLRGDARPESGGDDGTNVSAETKAASGESKLAKQDSQPELVTEEVVVLDKKPAMAEPKVVVAANKGPASAESVVVINHDEILPTPEYIESAPLVEHEIVASGACTQCNSTSSCGCKKGRRFGSSIRNWWYSTDIYRLHMQNIGNPCLFHERPFGLCNESFTEAMIVAGKVDRAMLHDYDFTQYPNGHIALSNRGEHELMRISDMMAELPLTLRVESTDDVQVDAARRMAVVNSIARLGLPIAPDQVQIAPDRTIGLNGTDAQSVHAVRLDEATTGASRSAPFRDSAGATNIPLITVPGADR